MPSHETLKGRLDEGGATFRVIDLNSPESVARLKLPEAKVLVLTQSVGK